MRKLFFPTFRTMVFLKFTRINSTPAGQYICKVVVMGPHERNYRQQQLGFRVVSVLTEAVRGAMILLKYNDLFVGNFLNL